MSRVLRDKFGVKVKRLVFKSTENCVCLPTRVSLSMVSIDHNTHTLTVGRWVPKCKALSSISISDSVMISTIFRSNKLTVLSYNVISPNRFITIMWVGEFTAYMTHTEGYKISMISSCCAI